MKPEYSKMKNLNTLVLEGFFLMYRKSTHYDLSIFLVRPLQEHR